MKSCDYCGKPITGRGRRFCGHACMRVYGRKLGQLRRKPEFMEYLCGDEHAETLEDRIEADDV